MGNSTSAVKPCPKIGSALSISKGTGKFPRDYRGHTSSDTKVITLSWPTASLDEDGEVVRGDAIVHSLGRTSDTGLPIRHYEASRVPSLKPKLGIFYPNNERIKPFYWMFPQSYHKKGLETKALSAKVIRNRKKYGADSRLTPDDFIVSRPFIPAVSKQACKTRPSVEDYNNHLLTFNEKLLDMKVDVMTTIAEAKSTIDMAANLATDLFKLYRAVRKADVKTVKKIFNGRNIKRNVGNSWRNKTAENRWLELQYGWSPLFADLSTLVTEIAEDKRACGPYIKATHSTLLHSRDYTSDSIRLSGFKGILKTSCYFVVDKDAARTMAQWNIGSNPLLTAWELVPYSFVVDWFIPIGDFLAQYSAANGLQYISGSTTSYIQYDGIVTKTWAFTGGGAAVDIEYQYVERCHEIQRTVHNTRPIGFPTVSGNLSVKKALNALALISQRR